MEPKKIKSFFSNTSVQIFIRNIILVCAAFLLPGGISLYAVLTIKQNDMDTAIRNLACIVSQLDVVRDSLENGSPIPKLKEELDLLIDNNDQADVLVVCDTDNIRYYQTDSSQVGESFIGNDQNNILEGKDSYICEAESPLGMQRRIYYSVKSEDGTVIGFVTVSALTKSWVIIRNRIILIFVLIFLVLIGFCVLLSTATTYEIRRILFGYTPEEFRKIYLSHTRVTDALNEGLIAVNNKGKVILINRAARELLNMPKEQVDEQKNIRNIYPDSQLPKVLNTGTEIPMHTLLLGDNQILASEMPIWNEERLEGAVSVFRDKTELTRLAEELTDAPYMVDTLRSFNYEFMNKLHIILGLLELQEYQQAREYILDIGMMSGKEVSHICQVIPADNLAALLIGKLIRARELGIEFSLKNDSYFHKKKRKLPVDCFITVTRNLIENAMDELNKEDFETKKIEVGIYSDEGNTIITCDDTGDGIPEEILFSVYDRHTTDRGENHRRRYAMIREITERYQGVVHIDTEVGMGSSIEVIFPM